MPQVKNKVELIKCTENAEQVIAMSAKLCYSNDDIDSLRRGVEEKDVSKFISKLLSLGHLSPIEHAVFTFSIEGVSRSLLAQITRHRIASFSVKSQRYVGVKEDFNYIIPPAIEELGIEAVAEFEKQMNVILGFYKGWQEKLGVGEKSNEDARFVLPNGAETKMIVTMNARELMHFFSLRCCNRAQWEIREVAWKMLELAYGKAPNLFSSTGAGCISGACHEGKMSCGKAKDVKQRFEELRSKI